MKPKLYIRIVLSALLALSAVTVLLKGWQYFGYNPLSIITILAVVVFVSFCVIMVVAMIRGQTIAKFSFILSIVIAIVAFLILVWLGITWYQDFAGVFCEEFFGSRASCTLPVFMYLAVFILHPYALIALGAFSFLGIMHQVPLRLR